MPARQACTASCARRQASGGALLGFAPLAILLAAAAGCTPAVKSVSPASVAAGGPAFSLTVLGSGFSSGASVQWNGAARATTYISATELVARIDAADIAATGNASVTVSSPETPGGPSSGSVISSKSRTISIVPRSVDATAYQIDPAHDGAMTFASVSFPSSAVWRASLGSGAPSNIAIADGRIFLTTATVAGSQLLALSQSSGLTVWGPQMMPTDTTGSAAVAYENGRVFVSAGGSLYAYDAATGALDWSSGFGASALGAPTAANGLVYVIVSATLYALDEASGAITWQRPLSAATGTAAATADGLYVTDTTSGCHTIDFRPATGEVIWDSSGNGSSCPQTAEGTAIVSAQLVYSPGSPGTSIFAAETGAGAGTLSDSLPAAFTGTMAYFPQGANLDAVDLANGTVAWTFNGDGSQLTALPIIVSQYVVSGTASGNLYAVDGTSGKQVWTQALGGQLEQLSAGDGLLLAVDETGNDGSGTLTAYRLSSGP